MFVTGTWSPEFSATLVCLSGPPKRTLRSLVALCVLAAAALPGGSPGSSSNYDARGSGGLLAFTSNGSGAWEVYIMNADGTARRGLTAGRREEHSPTWSPDGRKIAFVGDGIHVANVDGSGLRRLSPTGGSVRWSANGRKIYFLIERTYPEPHSIHVVDVETTQVRRLALDGPCGSCQAWWSPDGQRIAYRNDIDTGRHVITEVFVMDSDGRGRRRLTHNMSSVRDVSWSPDGTRLAYSGWSGFTSGIDAYLIYVVNADGTGQRALTRVRPGPGDRSPSDSAPVWSPNGRRIAFVRGDTRPQIYVMNADGRRQRSLTRNRSIAREPVWSPDGRRIAFVLSDRNRRSNVAVMDADGTEQRIVTQHRIGVGANDIAWSPRSR